MDLQMPYLTETKLKQEEYELNQIGHEKNRYIRE